MRPVWPHTGFALDLFDSRHGAWAELLVHLGVVAKTNDLRRQKELRMLHSEKTGKLGVDTQITRTSAKDELMKNTQPAKRRSALHRGSKQNPQWQTA